MIEKEFPIFAFEEMRRFGVDMHERKNDTEPLEVFLDSHKIERKQRHATFEILFTNQSQQYRRDTNSTYQVILYKNCIVLEFLIEHYDFEDIDKVCYEIQNCNRILIQEGDEGLKKMIKLLIRGTRSPNFLKEYYFDYDMSLLFILRYIKNPIQVEKTDQENTLKITYKIDL
ncbi:hypothetical protein ACE193_06890 [Bernardetia sp. OM2101]|uniref:hypothetical protein n=1 Tax=Bernardetia sp. OM2101 TaxID=3344876 RepID=UPI0035CFB524